MSDNGTAMPTEPRRRGPAQGTPPMKYGRRYNWDQWFDSDLFVLLRGRDFICQCHGMAGMVRNAACARGHRVHIMIATDDKSVTVQMIYRATEVKEDK